MTAGILLPAFVMIYFDKLSVGLVLSLGALGVSGTDNAGPIQHRRIAMSVCSLSIFIVALVIGYTSHYPVLMGVTLFVFSFFFSMLGVYGARATSLGVSSLLIMVLSINHPSHGWQILWNALYLLAGAVWYMAFSLVLYNVRPYRLAQQALGEYIQSVADYFRMRARFYNEHADYDAIYKSLLQQQVIVQEKQNLLNDLLFKTRAIVKESTPTGRILIMMYLDTVDLFERVMTSYQDYRTLHGFFEGTNILSKFHKVALDLADELDQIGIAVQSGKQSTENSSLWQDITTTKLEYRQLRKTFIKPGNIEGFIGLRGIIGNIQDIGDRLQTLHHYTSYDKKYLKAATHQIDYKKFITHQDITPRIFLDNLSFQSNIFRHSLRVSIAVIIGYLISLFFTIGHSYWILLTIVVILKPAYSLTKQRNFDRLIGTFCGAVLGVVILLLVKNNMALLVIMIMLMTGTFILIRSHYLISVSLMTPYVILFFHLLYPDNFLTVLRDRVIDTSIGSVIAFGASIFLVPAWEHTTITTYMIAMLEDNSAYFRNIANAFVAEESLEINNQQVARKNAFVALANLSDAFTRMLSEPKRHQKGIEKLHQFVVLNHMLISHIATLSYYMQSDTAPYRSQKLNGVSKDILQYLENAKLNLQGRPADEKAIMHKESLRLLNEKANVLLEQRRKELELGQLETSTIASLRDLKSVMDQFNFIYKIVEEIEKNCRQTTVDR
jgi:uncharacterized membrane protein (TIGR01666 family)